MAGDLAALDHDGYELVGQEDVFGPILSGKDVEDAALATLKLWAPAYLAEIGRSRSLSKPLPGFRSYTSKLVVSKAQEDQLPACVVVAPGTMGNAIRHSGQLTVVWSVGVGVIVSGQNTENTYDLCRYYLAACRVIMLQKSDLGGFARGVNFVSERCDEINSRSNNIRTLMAGIIHLGVEVGNITDTSRGPLVPPQDPHAMPEALQHVQSVNYEVGEVSG